MNVRHRDLHGVHDEHLRDSTIRDAMFRDYRCLVLEDCMAEPIGSEAERTNHEAKPRTAPV